MARDDKLTGTMQENVIAILAHDDDQGRLVSELVTPQLFEGEYRVIAERCIDYWQRHNQAPKAHVLDLFDEFLDDPKDRRGKLYRRILGQMQELARQANGAYIVTRLGDFVRTQRMKAAILESAERLQSAGPDALVSVEEIWSDLLHTKAAGTFEAGVQLLDFERALKFLQEQQGEFTFGIAPLDDANIFPARKQVSMLLAGAKRGKTWFLHHVGKHALMQRKTVAHISLEMYEDECVLRYYQALFALSRWDATQTTNRLFKKDERGRLLSMEEENVQLPYALSQPYIADNIRGDLRNFGSRCEKMFIKHFPTKTLTIRQLDAYFDQLEITEGFMPDMCILDYIGITNTDVKNHRLSLGRNMEDFRAMCDRRNMAGVTVGQLSRAGAEAMVADSTQVAEDWSLIGTADLVLAYSSTDAERKLGLGRCRVTNARHAKDSWGVVLSQNYHAGQWALDAAKLPEDYKDILDDVKDQAGISDGDGLTSEDDGEDE